VEYPAFALGALTVQVLGVGAPLANGAGGAAFISDAAGSPARASAGRAG